MTVPSPILVVEDDSEIREALAAFLEENGYRVAVAANGEEALRYLERDQVPWLILLDLTMPVMGGAEFMEKRRSIPGAPNIPVVVLTASPDPRILLREVPPTSILRKPIEPQILLARVNYFRERVSAPSP